MSPLGWIVAAVLAFIVLPLAIIATILYMDPFRGL